MDELMTRQTFRFPTILADLVGMCDYRDWDVHLYEDLNRGQGSQGLTLVITTNGVNAYHPEVTDYRVDHLFPVPAAAYDRRSWTHWLFEQFALVERHEAMEFFQIEGERPFAPHHGPGNDPYIVFDHGTELDVRTKFTGEVND